MLIAVSISMMVVMNNVLEEILIYAYNFIASVQCCKRYKCLGITSTGIVCVHDFCMMMIMTVGTGKDVDIHVWIAFLQYSEHRHLGSILTNYKDKL